MVNQRCIHQQFEVTIVEAKMVDCFFINFELLLWRRFCSNYVVKSLNLHILNWGSFIWRSNYWGLFSEFYPLLSVFGGGVLNYHFFSSWYDLLFSLITLIQINFLSNSSPKRRENDRSLKTRHWLFFGGTQPQKLLFCICLSVIGWWSFRINFGC